MHREVQAASFGGEATHQKWGTLTPKLPLRGTTHSAAATPFWVSHRQLFAVALPCCTFPPLLHHLTAVLDQELPHYLPFPIFYLGKGRQLRPETILNLVGLM